MVKPNDLVFTLQEDNKTEISSNTSQAIRIEGGANWEQSLAQLRQRRENVKQQPQATANAVEPHFNDEELNLAYRAYLEKREREHNSQVADIENTDIGILIQEDWLAAQTALQSERNRLHLQAKQTVVLHSQEKPVSEREMETASVKNETPDVNKLPEISVHVYDLPDLPATRKIKVLSEQELTQVLAEKLKVHLSNAIAGMVRQTITRELASISYNVQMELNRETPQIVEEVLAHHLAYIMRSVKEK